jgi:hypothetical protein
MQRTDALLGHAHTNVAIENNQLVEVPIGKYSSARATLPHPCVVPLEHVKARHVMSPCGKSFTAFMEPLLITTWLDTARHGTARQARHNLHGVLRLAQHCVTACHGHVTGMSRHVTACHGICHGMSKLEKRRATWSERERVANTTCEWPLR